MRTGLLEESVCQKGMRLLESHSDVLLLTNEFAPFAGGIATYCARLVESMTRYGQRVTVVAPCKVQGEDEYDRHASFPVRRAPEPPFAAARQVVRLFAAWRTCAKSRPRILWASDWRCGVALAIVARIMRLPLVVSAYGSEVLRASRSRFEGRIARWVYCHAATVLSISRYTMDLLIQLGVPSQRIQLTPLGSDPGVIDSESPDGDWARRRHSIEAKKIILTIARLVPRKGQDIMIQAMPAVLKAVPDAIYLIAGAGPDRARLEQLVNGLGLEDHVLFVGQIPEDRKAAYLRACDLFVMLSRQEGCEVEGFGLALLEAGGFARPVVAGNHGGVPEAVLHGETGLLVDPVDPDAVAQAVVQLLSDLELARELGGNALRRIRDEANWASVAERTLEAMRRAALPAV